MTSASCMLSKWKEVSAGGEGELVGGSATPLLAQALLRLLSASPCLELIEPRHQERHQKESLSPCAGLLAGLEKEWKA